MSILLLSQELLCIINSNITNLYNITYLILTNKRWNYKLFSKMCLDNFIFKNNIPYNILIKYINLEFLNVSSIAIEDISILEVYKKLNELSLYNCKNITSFNVLNYMYNIKKLDISFT